jgi:hypothetical protein
MAESSHQTMRYPRLRWLVFALLLVPSIALANPYKLADGYELAFASGHIEIRKATQRARVIAAAGIHEVTFDATKRAVTVEYDDAACIIQIRQTWTLAYLENTPAIALHRKRDYKAAVPGFERAITADPTWPIPAYNLASAHQLLGNKAAAVKALAPWLASHPARTYVQVTAPLLDQITTPRATTPGTATLTWRGIAYSPHHN